jgi:hypothetical protein
MVGRSICNKVARMTAFQQCEVTIDQILSKPGIQQNTELATKQINQEHFSDPSIDIWKNTTYQDISRMGTNSGLLFNMGPPQVEQYNNPYSLNIMSKNGNPPNKAQISASAMQSAQKQARANVPSNMATGGAQQPDALPTAGASQAGAQGGSFLHQPYMTDYNEVMDTLISPNMPSDLNNVYNNTQPCGTMAQYLVDPITRNQHRLGGISEYKMSSDNGSGKPSFERRWKPYNALPPRAWNPAMTYGPLTAVPLQSIWAKQPNDNQSRN